ncbi:MAG: FAD-binding oxidoreductase [Candidatus Odinarchaeia archaeon]
MEASVISELTAIVGENDISVKEADLVPYALDALSPSFTDGGPPDVVVLPENTLEVSEIVKLANREKIPVTPWGSGTGVMGGAIPLNKGIVVDLKKMNKVIFIDEESLNVTVQSGTVLEALERELNKHNLTLRYEPGTFRSSTVGGAIANAGIGMYAKRGAIGDHVLGLEAVLPTGEIVRSRPVFKTSTGGDTLNWLFIGSEGTLGIITEATLRVSQIPESREIYIVGFSDFKKAVKTLFKIYTLQIEPAILTAIDHPIWFIPKLEDFKGAALIVGLEGLNEIVKGQRKYVKEICLKNGGEFFSEEISESWWKNRFNWQSITAEFKVQMIDDSSFPSLSSFLKMYDIYLKLCEKYRLTPILAHIGYGDRMSMATLISVNIDDPDELNRALRWRDEIVAAKLKLGGVVMPSMGVGFDYSKYLELEHGEAMKVFKRIKRALDPNNIMNPGKRGLNNV